MRGSPERVGCLRPIGHPSVGRYLASGRRGNTLDALVWVPLIVAPGGVGALIASHQSRNLE
jgi:hypothetical protein